MQKFTILFIVFTSLFFCFSNIANADYYLQHGLQQQYRGTITDNQAKVTLSQDTGFANKILSQYKEKTEAWIPALKEFTFVLFRYFLIIDIIMFALSGGISIANGGKHLGQIIGEFIVLVVLPASFMYAVIKYYDVMSSEILTWFLATVATTVDPSLSKVAEGAFFQSGLVLFDKILEGISLTSPSSWGLLIAGFIILICYSLMSMQIVLIKAEAFITMSAGMLMLGFGSFNQTRQYATNFIRYILSVAIKLFVLQLMIGIAFSFVEDFLNTTNSLEDVAVVIGASVILLALIRCIPDICAGIVQGQHVSSGNALAGAIGNVTSAVTAGVSAGMGLAFAAKEGAGGINALAKAAKASGESNIGRFIAKNIADAGLHALRGDRSQTSSGRFNARMMENALRAQPTIEE